MAAEIDLPQRVLPTGRGKSATRVSRALRRRQITKRVLEGKSNQEIAEELGTTASAVAKYLSDILATWESAERSEVDAVRALQVARLDRIVQAHAPDAFGTRLDAEGSPIAPSRGAADLILRAEALRARIVGTEAARKLEVSGSLGFHLDAEEVEREARAWASSGGDVVDSTTREIEPPCEIKS